MKSEIIQELERNVGKMEELIFNQKFTVADAQKFLQRYFNILRKMEQLVESRDKWKEKFNKLNSENKKGFGRSYGLPSYKPSNQKREKG